MTEMIRGSHEMQQAYLCMPTNTFACQAIGLKNRRDWVLRSLLRLQVTSSRQETDISTLSRFHPVSLAEKTDLTMSGLIRRSHNAPGESGRLFNFEQLKVVPILRVCRLEMHLSSKSQGLINVEVPLTQYVWCHSVWPGIYIYQVFPFHEVCYWKQ